MGNAHRTGWQAAAWAILSGILAVIGKRLLRLDLAPWARTAVVIVPILPMLQYCRLLLRSIKEMDELQARIQLEGAIYGLLACAMSIMIGGLLTGNGVLPPVSLDDAWPFLWMIAFFGWGAGTLHAGRRYR